MHSREKSGQAKRKTAFERPPPRIYKKEREKVMLTLRYSLKKLIAKKQRVIYHSSVNKTKNVLEYKKFFTGGS
jgi:hypothetical protein